MMRNKLYSIISIAGLALGISSALLISLYIDDEFSYDDHHAKKDRTYRVTELIDHNGQIDAALTSLPVGPAFKNDYPEVETFTRFVRLGNRLTIHVEDRIFREENIWMTDSSVFEVFDIPVLAGKASEALKAPLTIVLTKTLADKFYGSADEALGKSIQVGSREYHVTAVVADPVQNSDIRFTALASISSIPEQQLTAFNQDWFRLVAYTFLVFQEPIRPGDFRDKMDEFSERYITPFAETFGASSSAHFTLQPLLNLHFLNDKEYDTPKGNLNYIYIFAVVGLFLLAIACINYINLSLSQSIKRAREVGVRKALGAGSAEIRWQFLGESLLVTLLSLLIALSLVELFLPAFNGITNKTLSMGDLFTPTLVLTLILITLSIAFLAGSYPALVLSRFQAVTVLKGTLPKIGRSGAVRKSLLVIQFSFSIFMIIGTLVVYAQMSYLKNKDLGFEQENVVVITIPQDTAVYNNLAYFKNELMKDARIHEVTGTQNMPGLRVGELMFRIEQEGQMQDRGIKVMSLDDAFLDMMGIELVHGRAFDKTIQTDVQQGFLINETAAREFGWFDEAVGKRM